jgi:hypothetical protein
VEIDPERQHEFWMPGLINFYSQDMGINGLNNPRLWFGIANRSVTCLFKTTALWLWEISIYHSAQKAESKTPITIISATVMTIGLKRIQVVLSSVIFIFEHLKGGYNESDYALQKLCLHHKLFLKTVNKKKIRCFLTFSLTFIFNQQNNTAEPGIYFLRTINFAFFLAAWGYY